MTINVAVKCPDGIVLGADSLVSIMAPGSGSNAAAPLYPQAYAPYHRKLFQVANLPVGVMLNGDTAVSAQTIDDILAEFGVTFTAGRRVVPYTLAELAGRLSAFMEEKIGAGPRPSLQLIVGGFSRGGGSGARYGELFTITWPEGSVESLYEGDKAFGAYFGGRSDPIYRFLSGFDRVTARSFVSEWKTLFEQTRDYVVEQIERAGGTVPDEVRELDVPPLRRVHPWSLLSTFDLAGSPEDLKVPEMMRLIAESSRLPYQPNYRYFSLRMAIDFTWHLLLLPYAESSFMNQLPVVGSDLRIAAITRDGGFERIWRGQPGVAHDS